GICQHLGMGFRHQRGRESHRRARDQKRDGEESRPIGRFPRLLREGSRTSSPRSIFFQPIVVTPGGRKNDAHGCARECGMRGVRSKVKIDLVWSDYGYRIPDALSLYRKYRDVDQVNAIVGWGTGDTEALKETISQDQIPYISASYSSHLDDPAKTPYNFYPVSSYSDQIRAVLKYLKDVAAQEGISKPKIVFLYPDHPYGRAPIPAGKAYAQELGFVVGTDQIVALAALEARSQVAAVKAFGADFAWIGGTTNSASVIVRDARAAGLTTRFAVNVWGFDENMIKLIGKDADGVIATTPHVYYGEPSAGMTKIFDALRRFYNKPP